MIIRTTQRADFVIIPRAIAQARGLLPFDSRGLLLYLLSKPADWQVTLADIRAEGDDGRDKVKRMLGDLIDAGYLVKTQGRASEGRFGNVEYTVYDVPHGGSAPSTDYPSTAEPSTDNPPHTKEREPQRTEGPSSTLRADDAARDPWAPVAATLDEAGLRMYRADGSGLLARAGQLLGRIGRAVDSDPDRALALVEAYVDSPHFFSVRTHDDAHRTFARYVEQHEAAIEGPPGDRRAYDETAFGWALREPGDVIDEHCPDADRDDPSTWPGWLFDVYNDAGRIHDTPTGVIYA